ncbi:P-loop containing nucleoside triphosphate hydrolase protein [Trametes versicolor FP-101664 SS1]|uniref:P-loop containing nucleoside triphosphate hydrolase protein n=1 Tax=Trametes versicolor (strain FP-101664) TaxID=717944 RepID=UPI0004623698|nr:P-loop containing nucleoside triphosphate hydrolase protein [Trametes versicolor FP-101664 SS1]EIW55821.1 P-loop containing nucleoside triphosphate hydrolase protein [Trametes versicolor FP-101664 SS1]
MSPPDPASVGTAAVDPRAASHAEARKRSYALLEEARAAAKKKKKYDSHATRQAMIEESKKRAGLTPYPEQLDLAECMLLGLDSTTIAGTGWGKTLPFVLPLFAPQSRGKIIIIVSPLNSLEADQATRFRKMNISTAVVNGETQTPELLDDIAQGKYSVVIIGPKLLTERQSTFRTLLSNAKFTKRVLALVVDEAHCIAQWGGEFRPEYSDLGDVRALLTLNTSVCAFSATMKPSALALARKTLHILPNRSFHLNIGNDRPNITWEVRYMTAGKSNLDVLGFLLPANVATLAKLPMRRMLFFDDINVSMNACRWLIERLPPILQSRVKVYNARRCTLAKDLVMQDFRQGKLDILLTTEAAGMGCDIPDVVESIQFMAPESLSVWMQRAGRAGRHPDIQARAILLIQPTVFQEKGKRSRQDGEVVAYVKEIEDGLRMWLDPERCRRDVADEYFDNPPTRKRM